MSDTEAIGTPYRSGSLSGSPPQAAARSETIAGPVSSLNFPLQLNDDVFITIAEVLFIERALLPFSMTCRSIRERCMSMLFRESVFSATAPVTSSDIPQRILPYVRSLTIIDRCPDVYAWDNLMGRTESRTPVVLEPQYTDDPLLCGVLDGEVLHAALSAMPLLHTFQLRLDGSAVHGLPPRVLHGILTVPHLQRFTCTGYTISPRSSALEDAMFHSLAKLSSFEYSRDDYRHEPRVYDSEAQMLRLILRHLHQTLEVLAIPVEAAPLPLLRDISWPSLRVLKLRGEPVSSEEHYTPSILTLKNMPALRRLDLQFATREGIFPQPIWPRGYRLDSVLTSPWPDLEHLTVSFPSASDEIFEHLPNTLRSLTLQYYPHLSTHRWTVDNTNAQWQWPVVTATEVLRILRTCVPDLERLEVEYHQDDGEERLLEYIAGAFPNLTSLCIRRYRAPDVSQVDVEGIARPLGALAHLRVLYLHLDLPETPVPAPVRWGRDIQAQDERPYAQALDRSAEVLARNLGPSVELIKLLRPHEAYYWDHPWAVYKVSRGSDPDSGTSGRAEYSSELSRDPPQVLT
ncbi:hypothetical protein BV20DRAFT_975852 [Pilatotrama ljubarskyi]|nr:hypothetical protein BV20DRAFT_975852 [Pilatotrama ljubarskyi]